VGKYRETTAGTGKKSWDYRGTRNSTCGNLMGVGMDN